MGLIGSAYARLHRSLSRADGKCAILLYHRVHTTPTDPQLLCVSPNRFAEHLEVLRDRFRPITLGSLAAAVRKGSVPDRSVVVTFDDGYADGLHQAKPLLERYDVPATVYIVAGQVGGPHEFWWDQLDQLLLQPGTLPRTFRLAVNGSVCEGVLGDDAHYTREAFEQRRTWNPEQGDRTPRQNLYCRLQGLLRPLGHRDRLNALRQLSEWAGAELTLRESHRALDAGEVARLAEGGLIEVGAHTMTHPVLSTLSPTEQRGEIGQSRRFLEDLLGRRVRSFSYPYGTRQDYTADTVALVRAGGFASACSNFAGLAGRDRDPFQLPRFIVRDWDGDTLARKLGEWFAQ